MSLTRLRGEEMEKQFQNRSFPSAIVAVKNNEAIGFIGISRGAQHVIVCSKELVHDYLGYGSMCHYGLPFLMSGEPVIIKFFFLDNMVKQFLDNIQSVLLSINILNIVWQCRLIERLSKNPESMILRCVSN